MDTRKRSTKTFNEGIEGLGQNGLYWQLLRDVAKKEKPRASAATHSAVADMLHEIFKIMFNGGKSTSNLSVTDFKSYFDHCQRFCIERFDVSGMKEDAKPFDHGFVEAKEV